MANHHKEKRITDEDSIFLEDLLHPLELRRFSRGKKRFAKPLSLADWVEDRRGFRHKL